MKIAFVLFRFFPHGGLQRDFRAIAESCGRRGHLVSVYTMAWESPTPCPFRLEIIASRAWSNHRRCRDFARSVRDRLKHDAINIVVGFNKLPGLDFYFAADPCFVARARQRTCFYRLTSRYRTYAALERAVFEPGGRTRILVLSESQKQSYMNAWATPSERFHLLMPGISRDRLAPTNRAEIRRTLREEWGIPPEEFLVLMVGSGFRTKGLDRALRALAALPAPLRSRTRLFVIGHGRVGPYLRLASRLGIPDRFRLLGGRDDVTRYLLGADLLLHPSRTETYGMVLLEAMACGLPVLATGACGYSDHVRQAEAGLMVPEPYKQSDLNDLLARMLGSVRHERWNRNGLEYIARTDVFSLPDKAADLIESRGIESHAG